jgi:hypothetical protein
VVPSERPIAHARLRAKSPPSMTWRPIAVTTASMTGADTSPMRSRSSIALKGSAPVPTSRCPASESLRIFARAATR